MDSQVVIEAFIENVEFETGMLLRPEEVSLHTVSENVQVSVFGEEIGASEIAESDADTAQALFESISQPRSTIAEARMPLLLPALQASLPLIFKVWEESGIGGQIQEMPQPELQVWDGMGFHWETDTETYTGWPNIGLVMENYDEEFDFRFAFNIYDTENAFDPVELDAELRAYCADWMD